jgi:hypothetical protein
MVQWPLGSCELISHGSCLDDVGRSRGFERGASVRGLLEIRTIDEVRNAMVSGAIKGPGKFW